MKSVIFWIFIFFLLAAGKVLASPELVVTNNGPAVLNSPITFSVSLTNYFKKHPLTYVFDDGIQKTEIENQSFHVEFRRLFTSEQYKEGSYYMNVTVNAYILFYTETIAVNSTRFHLSSLLLGDIGVHPSDHKDKDVDEVAILDNVTLALNLIDNNNFLQSYSLDYSWNVEGEVQETLDNILIYNFTEQGVKHISAQVTAFNFHNNDFKYGYFEKTITAKVPVQNVNITGNPFLYHGDTLNLNVTCNGTPPFTYCYEVLRSNASHENFSCSHMSTFTTCHMEIIKYIQNDGTYNVGIYISNNVAEKTRIIEVMVYSVRVRPTLSTVIIPIVCSLLTLLIIAVGVSYYRQQKNRLVVETADFNFQEESDSYTERTFFENVLDSFSCRSCAGGGPFSCGRNADEGEPLICEA